MFNLLLISLALSLEQMAEAWVAASCFTGVYCASVYEHDSP